MQVCRHRIGVSVAFLGLLGLAACGSSTPSQGGADSAVAPDSTVKNDAAVAPEDATPATDSPVAVDASAADAKGEVAEVATSEAPPALDSGPASADSGLASTDGTSDGARSPEDAGADAADAAFVPGPPTAVVVNSSNSAKFAVSDGTWQMFYFDAVAGQIYAVSGLGGIITGYIGTSATVSPSNYQLKTNADGVVSFTAATAARYYVAVAASGGGSTGYFQVADGGTLLGLGATLLSLAAPDGDTTYFYRFPVTAGHGYVLDAQGPSQPNVGIAVSPRAERSTSGQFSYSAWGVAGSLPFSNQAITSASVAESYSGYYYFYVNAKGAITLTVTISQAP